MSFAKTSVAVAMAVLSASAASAFAEDEQLRIEQIGLAADPPAEPVQQIAPRSNRTDAPGPVPARPAGSLSQLSSGAESTPATPQLTSEGQSAEQPTQLYSGGRTAQPLEPLSRPSQGRTGPIARVEGDDRCDPAMGGERMEACERVIETRSTEFTRPDPTVLSPEQRLLIDQRLREMPATARAGARRLATDGTDAESEETQNVASLVLRPALPPRNETETPAAEQDTSTAAAVAIVNAIVNPGSGTPPN